MMQELQAVLNAQLSVPVTGASLPSIQLDQLLDIVESTPLLDGWKESIGSLRGSTAVGENGFDRRGRQWQRKSLKGGLEKGRSKVLEDDWSAVSVGGVKMDNASPFGYWTYDLELGFVTAADTGEYMARWGGLSLTVTCPDLLNRLSGDWSDVVMEFMKAGSSALGAELGYCCVADGSKAFFPVDGYAYRNFPLPPKEPETIPGIQWVFVLPPLTVARLGGWEQVSADVPVHRCDPIVHQDGRIGALIQTTPTLAEFDSQVRDNLLEYLGPVLG